MARRLLRSCAVRTLRLLASFTPPASSLFLDGDDQLAEVPESRRENGENQVQSRREPGAFVPAFSPALFAAFDAYPQ